MYGRRTVVHLANPEADIEKKIDLPFVRDIDRIDDTLVMLVNDPETDNPKIVRHLVGLGAQVQFVNELRVSLEDLYLDMMEDKHASN